MRRPPRRSPTCRRGRQEAGHEPAGAHDIGASACPHDCPSTCALEVEVLDAHTIGRVRGAADNDYTAGVICAKVARYAERVHHPDAADCRRCGRKGAQGLGRIRADLLGRRARPRRREASSRRSSATASEAVWPYYYAGTMGLVMRDGIHRLRHAKNYSGVPRDDLQQPGLGRASPPAPAASPGPIRARWRSPTSSSSGAPTRSTRRST